MSFWSVSMTQSWFWYEVCDCRLRWHFPAKYRKFQEIQEMDFFWRKTALSFNHILFPFKSCHLSSIMLTFRSTPAMTVSRVKVSSPSIWLVEKDATQGDLSIEVRNYCKSRVFKKLASERLFWVYLAWRIWQTFSDDRRCCCCRSQSQLDRKYETQLGCLFTCWNILSNQSKFFIVPCDSVFSKRCPFWNLSTLEIDEEMTRRNTLSTQKCWDEITSVLINILVLKLFNHLRLTRKCIRNSQSHCGNEVNKRTSFWESVGWQKFGGNVFCCAVLCPV